MECVGAESLPRAVCNNSSTLRVKAISVQPLCPVSKFSLQLLGMSFPTLFWGFCVLFFSPQVGCYWCVEKLLVRL